MMLHTQTTTAFTLPNREIADSLGVVCGIVVRSRSIFGNVLGMLQSIWGGNISVYTSLCERAREDAFHKMCDNAERLGGDAIIGVRYESNDVMAGVTEVLCYGTAVRIKR